jgi:hypothetical protein
MSLNHVLLEREFEKYRGGLTYKVKARAVFLVDQFPEAGKWHVGFDVQTTQPAVFAPDQRLMSKARAQQAAEHIFNSGLVERFIDRDLQSWIIIGAIDPVFRKGP